MHGYSTVELMEQPLWADSSTRELFPALSLTGPFARPAPPLSCSGSWAFLRWRIKAIRYNLYIHVSNFQKYVFTCSSFNEIQRQNKSFFPGFFSHTGIEYHILKGVFHPVIEINFCGCHGRGTKDNWVTGDQRHFGGPKTFWGAKDILGDQSRQSPKSWEDQSADGTKELGGQKVQETI